MESLTIVRSIMKGITIIIVVVVLVIAIVFVILLSFENLKRMYYYFMKFRSLIQVFIGIIS